MLMFVNDVKGLGGGRERVGAPKTRKANSVFKGFVADAQSMDVGDVNEAASVKLSAINLPFQWQLPLASKKASYSYGDDLLNLLKKLHRHIILGGDAKEVLNQLRQATQNKAPLADDVELNELINAIKLRAAVEVAKRKA